MLSPINAPVTENESAKRKLDVFKIWNRRGHYYLGLYFLFFLWLFAFTGLLLNHSWKFAEFWPTRRVSNFERQIAISQASTNLDQARETMRQLGITGEIEWTAKKPESTGLEFRVNRPGHSFNITMHSDQGLAKVEQTEINGWGIMRVLHTFTGVRPTDDRNDRDWVLTTVWVLSMDAVSAGLVLMVLSGLYMWFGMPTKRNLGMAALALGTSICGLLVAGLRWIYS